MPQFTTSNVCFLKFVHEKVLEGSTKLDPLSATQLQSKTTSYFVDLKLPTYVCRFEITSVNSTISVSFAGTPGDARTPSSLTYPVSTTTTATDACTCQGNELTDYSI